MKKKDFSLAGREFRSSLSILGLVSGMRLGNTKCCSFRIFSAVSFFGINRKYLAVRRPGILHHLQLPTGRAPRVTTATIRQTATLAALPITDARVDIDTGMIEGKRESACLHFVCHVCKFASLYILMDKVDPHSDSTLLPPVA